MEEAEGGGTMNIRTGIKALSIRQPWAWLIVNGHKDIENRSWKTFYRGPILIHAGKSLDFQAFDWIAKNTNVQISKEIRSEIKRQTGGFVGRARLTECVVTSTSVWFQGDFGLVMRDAFALPFMKFPGQLNLFEVPPSIVRQFLKADPVWSEGVLQTNPRGAQL